MRPSLRGLTCSALLAAAFLAAGPANGQTINTMFGFQLYNHSGQDATITVENQGRSTTVRAGGSGSVSTLPFVSYANPSKAYYRIVIASGGQVLYNGVHEISYNYRKQGFAPALEQLFCLQADAAMPGRRIGVPRIVQQGLSCLYEFILR